MVPRGALVMAAAAGFMPQNLQGAEGEASREFREQATISTGRSRPLPASIREAAADMLVKFSTRFGQLVMQGEPAVALIRLGGHSGTVPSAVLAADLPGFLAKLRAGLELQGDQVSPPPPAKEPGGSWEDDEEPRERPIKLRLRAVPLLDLLETAIRQHSDLFWEKA
jgi:hypothetical protein